MWSGGVIVIDNVMIMKENTSIYNNIKNTVLEWLDEDKEHIVELCSELVRCNTQDPPGDTREAMTVVKDFMKRNDLSYEVLAMREDMPNLIASQFFSSDGLHIMFNGHLDTLPAGEEPGWTDNPWSGKIADGQIWGRGSGDMKGGVTAMMFAYKYLSRLKDYLGGSISLTLVSDEETGEGRGTGYLFSEIPERMKADCVMSAEPSGIEAVSFASKGYIQYEVSISTPGAIGGYCNDSKSAIRIAADIMRELDRLGDIKVSLPAEMAEMLSNQKWVARHTELRGEGHATLIGKVTTDISTVSGGSIPGVIAPDCVFTATTVIPVGTDPEDVLRRIQEIISHYPEATVEALEADKADWCSPFSAFSKTIQDTAEDLSGIRPEMTPDIAISDLRYWRYRGIPGYWYGPDSTKCSAANESVSIDEILHVIAVYVLTVFRLLASPKDS